MSKSTQKKGPLLLGGLVLLSVPFLLRRPRSLEVVEGSTKWFLESQHYRNNTRCVLGTILLATLPRQEPGMVAGDLTKTAPHHPLSQALTLVGEIECVLYSQLLVECLTTMQQWKARERTTWWIAIKTGRYESRQDLEMGACFIATALHGTCSFSLSPNFHRYPRACPWREHPIYL